MSRLSRRIRKSLGITQILNDLAHLHSVVAKVLIEQPEEVAYVHKTEIRPQEMSCGVSPDLGIRLPRDSSMDGLPDVSTLNYVELAELEEAVHRRSRLLEASYNFQLVMRLTNQIWGHSAQYLKQKLDSSDCRVFEVGCGHFNPFSLSLRFYLNGCGRILAGDFSPIFRPYIAARWMYNAALHAIAFPDQWVLGDGNPDGEIIGQIRSRALSLPLAELANGNFDSLISSLDNNFNYLQLQYNRELIDADSIDFMYSIAVLEHVMDPASDMAWQFSILRPGSCYFFLIGLEDHRFLEDRSNFQPWSFMVDGVYGAESNIRGDLIINGLRSSQYRKLLEDVGFEIEMWKEEPVYEAPSDLRQKVRPEFQSLPWSDLATFRITALVRKPLT
jgi:SAM-dependent methyltransferase